MIPTRRLFIALWLWAGLGLLVSIWPAYRQLWSIAGTALSLLVVFDLWGVRQRWAVQVSRRIASSLPVGVWTWVELEIHNPKGAPVAIEVMDHYPEPADNEDLPAQVVLPPRAWTRLRYRLRPNQRGAFRFAPAQIRRRSALGFWQRDVFSGPDSEVRVYPNFQAVAKYAILAQDQRTALMGIRKRRRRGEGMEFHQLREYREGDTMRQIDWKATARMEKLISRDYQDEKDQQIVFLVDCGRRMLAKDGNLSHFDHALNATLLLTYIALRQGDAVGMLSFSGTPRWLPPRKGLTAMNHMLNTLYDLHAGLHTPDYSQAVQQLMARQSRRALVVLLTNLRDEDGDDLLPALHLLRRRHLVLLANLREPVLDRMLESDIGTLDQALERAAAHAYLAHRQQAHEGIKRAGVLSLDVPPDQLAVQVVNRYLSIKSSGML